MKAAPGSGMNLSPLPYFIGKCLVELPRIIILTFCFAASYFPIVEPLCSPGWVPAELNAIEMLNFRF